MNKKADFGNDLATLNENVDAEVGDVLSVLQEKRTANHSTLIVKESPQPKAQAESPSIGGATEEPPATTTSAPRRQRSAGRSRLALAVEHDEPLKNISTRLRQKTNELLTEAALRQRLKKESPATRQDVVEAALCDWFRRHGYLRNGNDDGSD